MRILMLTDRFPPEVRSAAHLFHELARELRRRGHDVAVITKAPREYISAWDGRPLAPGWSHVDGVETLRVRGFPIPGHHPVLRGLDHLTLGWTFRCASRQWPRADVVLVYSPPLPLAAAGAAYARTSGCPFVLNVQDLYPQTAMDLGLLRNPLAIALAEKLEQRAYRSASRIVVHSPGNQAFLSTRKGVPGEKVHVIYNWVDTEFVRPGASDNDFRRGHGLADRFVVSYAGLMGYAQDLSGIIQCAERMRGEQDVLFLLVGEGVLEHRWKTMVADLRLGNVRFLPMQPRAAYVQLLAASDVCLVPLDAALRTPVIPGKLQSIMACARPAITITAPESDAPGILTESGGGINVPPGDSEALAGAVLRLKADPATRREMGNRGRAFAERHFSLNRCADQYEKLFQELILERHSKSWRC